MNDNYPCRYRAFLRICHAEGKNAKQVFQEAKLDTQTERKLRSWKPVEPWVYLRLSNVLKCEPTSLYYAPEYPSLHDVPTRAFADRVEDLLDEDLIPATHPDTGEPVDVVEYVWQMGDPVINGIALTHQQERDAYLLLRDEYQRLIERPIHTGTRRNQLGKFHIAVQWQEDIIADIKVREALANAAYDMIYEQQINNNNVHLERIKEELPHRFQHYLECVQQDESNDCFDSQIADDLVQAINAYLVAQKGALKYDDNPVNRSIGVHIRRYLAESYQHTVSQQSINNVIDADFFCRKIIFPTHQQDNIFHQCYSRSRALIRLRMKRSSPQDFLAWWSNWREVNTDLLSSFCGAWQEPTLDWDAIRDPIKRMVEALISEVKELYPSMTKTDTTLEQRGKLLQSREGKGK